MCDDSAGEFVGVALDVEAFAMHAPFGKSSGITPNLCSVLHESRISSCKAGVTKIRIFYRYLAIMVRLTKPSNFKIPELKQ